VLVHQANEMGAVRDDVGAWEVQPGDITVGLGQVMTINLTSSLPGKRRK
jgi:hypothetical protein